METEMEIMQRREVQKSRADNWSVTDVYRSGKTCVHYFSSFAMGSEFVSTAKKIIGAGGPLVRSYLTNPNGEIVHDWSAEYV